MKLVLLFTFLLIINNAAQEKNPYPVTSAEKRFEAYNQRMELQNNSLLKNVELRSIGPSIFNARIVDLDVNEDNPNEFYVAYASGGLWKTTNNGITFFPLFDNFATMTIGDIAVNWKNEEIIWLGGGENNSSRSSYAGSGIYKSTNKGESWEYTGLAETQRTGRIILHPENPDIVWVASIGNLYSPSKERGIYKTTDGGKNWFNTLFIDENTGAIDLVIHPENPNILYAAMWYRTRRAWNFVEGGQTSGIYKSEDGGNSWKLISTNESGIPNGEGVGRIGLAIFPKNPEIIYAFLDNQFRREDDKKESGKLTKDLIRNMSVEDFLSLDENAVNDFLDENNFPQKYNANLVFDLIENNKIKPFHLVDYLEDANSQLFDTPVKGAELYISKDGGKNWSRTHEKYIDDMYYSYGYYFGEVRVDPNDYNKVYLLGVPILKSDNAGKTFSSINEANVHVDHHAMWINPNKSGHLILGNDGGLNISYDDGKNWFKAQNPPVGQFYTVNVDMARPYNVYGGTQDNGVWFGPSNYKAGTGWQMRGDYPYKNILGGDGMQIVIDTTDNNTVYTGYQFGFYFRIDMLNKKYTSVKPQHELGERPLRFNWQTPVHLSVHNKEIFYIGANKLYRSLNKGENLEAISEDLTKGGLKGNVPYGTLTSIDESPFKFGLIYTGSDDGLIHISKDGGNNWKRISDKLPQNLWVSRVYASRHDESVVYVSLNGYRWDHFDSYVYRSSDFGESWERIGLNIPAEPVNVIKEDPINNNILYVGTDHALYVSLDKGKTFMALFNGMPAAPVHDLVIHPRDKEIVVGTHGRSIFTADVNYIQQLDELILNKKLHLFPITSLTHNINWGNRNYTWNEPFEPNLKTVYFAGNNGTSNIKILTEDNLLLAELIDTVDKGLNYFNYDLTFEEINLTSYKEKIRTSLEKKNENDIESKIELFFKEKETKKNYLLPGKYVIEISFNGETVRQNFEIKEQRIKTRKEEKKIP